MTDRGRTAIGSGVAALFLTAILGGFYLSTWSEVMAVFLTFGIGLFISLGGLSDRESSN
jgi:hypothetical protein